MRRPVSGGQSGQSTDDVDVESGFGDVEADEVVGAAGGEHRIGRREGHQTGLGHPRSGAEQQLLGHPHLEVPLRERLREDVMSVYLPRSAVNPTIRSSFSAASTRAWPNGAGVVRTPGSANDAIIAEVRSGALVVIFNSLVVCPSTS